MEREKKSFLIPVTVNTGMSGHLLRTKGKKDSSHLKNTNQQQKQISRSSGNTLTGCRCPGYILLWMLRIYTESQRVINGKTVFKKDSH